MALVQPKPEDSLVAAGPNQMVPPPVFPGWVALGRVPGTVLKSGDALVWPFHSQDDVWTTPQTGYNDWVESHVGQALGGPEIGILSTHWCLYRPIRWRRLTEKETETHGALPMKGDVFLRRGVTDPNLASSEGHDENKYGWTISDPTHYRGNAMRIYTGAGFTIWRCEGGQPPGPYVHRLPGSKHHSEVAPLP